MCLRPGGQPTWNAEDLRRGLCGWVWGKGRAGRKRVGVREGVREGESKEGHRDKCKVYFSGSEGRRDHGS